MPFIPDNGLTHQGLSVGTQAMKQITLNVLTRKETGSSAANRLRKAGKIPAIIYGKAGSNPLTLEKTEWRTLWKKVSKEAALIEIHNEEGDKMLSIIKDIQCDPLTDNFLHIDFHEVSTTEKITTPVPIHLEGEAIGVKNERAVLDVHLHEIEISCLPKDLPSLVELDVTELHADESLYVSHLPAIDGVTYVPNPKTVVVSCIGPKGKDSDEPEKEAVDEETTPSEEVEKEPVKSKE